MKKSARPLTRRRSRKGQRVQYTVRDISPSADAALRRKAAKEGKSMNALLRETLEREAGLGGGDVVYNDLDPLVGLWEADPDFDAAIAAQDRVDEDLWR